MIHWILLESSVFVIVWIFEGARLDRKAHLELALARLRDSDLDDRG